MNKGELRNKKNGERICDILKTGKSLRSAAEAVGCDPMSILQWRDEDTEFALQYGKAREAGYRLLQDEILDISDQATGEDIQVARLRVDTRKWILSKVLPKIYGDKLDVDATVSAMVTHRTVEEILKDAEARK